MSLLGDLFGAAKTTLTILGGDEEERAELRAEVARKLKEHQPALEAGWERLQALAERSDGTIETEGEERNE